MGIGFRCIGKKAAEDDIRTVTGCDDKASLLDMFKVMGKLHCSDLEIFHLAVEALLIAAQTFGPEGNGDLTDRRFLEDRVQGA
jgi:hypothetical protein